MIPYRDGAHSVNLGGAGVTNADLVLVLGSIGIAYERGRRGRS